MRRKGFTLVELLVVIAIIALLMGILMPALSKVRQIAFRLICGTNLSGIGKAMLVYANDYDDEFPRAGGRNSEWGIGSCVNWNALTQQAAFGTSANGSGGKGTITSCFYLLVKYAEVTPKSFICKGDSGVTEFEPSDYEAGNRDLVSLWDFGPKGTDHCSYSYHLPYSSFVITTSSEPGMAVAADPNPWYDKKNDWNAFNPAGDKEAIQFGNATTHQEEGQNILFVDSHVDFQNVSFCGINEDNVYTPQGINVDIRKGIKPWETNAPANRSDVVLLDDMLNKGRGCFPEDTEVWVNGTTIKISEAAKDQIIGKSCAATKTLYLRKIEKVDIHDDSFDCRDIYLENGNYITVVSEHRFMLDSGLWVGANHLKSGMILKSLNGPIRITTVIKRPMPFVGKVYNLKVLDGEQYFVGKDGIVVRDW